MTWKWFAYPALGLLGLILIAVVVLVALGFRADAGRVRASVVIARVPAAIWPWLREAELLKSWVSWLVDVRADGPKREVWVMEDANNGGQRMEMVSEILVSDAPKRLDVHVTASYGFDGDASYVLTDLGGGRTQVETDSRWRYGSGFARLMEPLITPQANAKMQRDLETLRSRIEAAAP